MDTLIESRSEANSSRARMITVLDAVACGLMPPEGCRACRVTFANRCRECAQALTRAVKVNLAIDATESAATEADALAIYLACLLGLAGIGTAP